MCSRMSDPIVECIFEKKVKRKQLLNYNINFGVSKQVVYQWQEYELTTYDRQELNYNQIALS